MSWFSFRLPTANAVTGAAGDGANEMVLILGASEKCGSQGRRGRVWTGAFFAGFFSLLFCDI